MDKTGVKLTNFLKKNSYSARKEKTCLLFSANVTVNLSNL